MAQVFALNGCREVLESTNGAIHIEQQIIALEKAVIETPDLAFDLSKSLVETTCKTILTDKGITMNGREDLPRLFRMALDGLQLMPQENQQSNLSIRKTLGGLQTAVQGLCELRQNHGLASHGRDAYSLPMDAVQASLAAMAADCVVSFLFKVHTSYRSQNQRIFYQDYSEFNNHIDELFQQVQIFDLAFAPSEVLFKTDEESYREYLQEFEGQESVTDG